ncbi:hypothetical protein [Neomicrococcus lactis]|uniref:hypothetical protein n=1 Tax=Neomicrococcus lactis TaxID=732241 RepID=UPI0022FFCEE4|nr:hypothetical protein [Neomicrococcus lactis]
MRIAVFPSSVYATFVEVLAEELHEGAFPLGATNEMHVAGGEAAANDAAEAAAI